MLRWIVHSPTRSVHSLTLIPQIRSLFYVSLLYDRQTEEGDVSGSRRRRLRDVLLEIVSIRGNDCEGSKGGENATWRRFSDKVALISWRLKKKKYFVHKCHWKIHFYLPTHSRVTLNGSAASRVLIAKAGQGLPRINWIHFDTVRIIRKRH